MTKTQKALYAVQTKVSEHTTRFAALERKTDRTTTEQTEFEGLDRAGDALQLELRSSIKAVEAEGEAALVKGGTTDSESKERLELRSKSRVGAFMEAALNGRSVDGAEAEFAAAEGCHGGHMPISIFDSGRPVRLETRAITPGVDAEGSTTPTSPFAFERSVAASILGIQFPVVQAGVQNVPVITTAPPSAAVAKSTAAVSTAAAVRLDTRIPKRIAGEFEVRVEDLAVMPSLESDLRTAMMASVSNTVDEQTIAGNGTAPNLTGLFELATDVAAATVLETFASGVARFAKLVDGKFANALTDLHAIIGSDSFGVYSGLFAGNGSMSLADYLRERLGGFSVSNRVPAKNANAQKGLVTLTGGAAPFRAHVWNNVELLSDPYSKSGSGIRVITATVLMGDVHAPYGTDTIKETHPKIS